MEIAPITIKLLHHASNLTLCFLYTRLPLQIMAMVFRWIDDKLIATWMIVMMFAPQPLIAMIEKTIQLSHVGNRYARVNVLVVAEQ